MGSCPVIKEICSNLLRLDRIDVNNPTEVLFAFPSAKMGTRCVLCLAAIIIKKFIIQHFYSIQTATAPTNMALIWMNSLRRYADLCLRHEAQTRLLIDHLFLFDRGKTPPAAKKFNTILALLAQLNSAFQLRWSDSLYEELFGQELDQFITYGEDTAPTGSTTYPI
jgi:hypothetical protein